jgi:RNA polymerase sigma factor (sigma-70 family)
MVQQNQAIDSELLAAARAGDREAHSALYERFAPMVFTAARRILASTELAEDAVQDTFVEVIRSVASFREEAAIEAWIRRIAINKALSQLRSAWWSRRVDFDRFDQLIGVSGHERTDAQIEIGELLDRLPPAARAVVWLHDGEGYTHGEIAELMGRSVSFSKSQLKRARDRLRADCHGGTDADNLGSLWTSTAKTW